MSGNEAAHAINLILAKELGEELRKFSTLARKRDEALSARVDEMLSAMEANEEEIPAPKWQLNEVLVDFAPITTFEIISDDPNNAPGFRFLSLMDTTDSHRELAIFIVQKLNERDQ